MEEKMLKVEDGSGKEVKKEQTPHELYNHHLQNPGEAITDEDIRNLKIDTGAVAKDHQLSNEEAINNTVSREESKSRDGLNLEEDSDAEKPKASPYDILGN